MWFIFGGQKVEVTDNVMQLVKGEFNPQTVAALAHRLGTPMILDPTLRILSPISGRGLSASG